MKVKVTNVILSSNPYIIKIPRGRCNFYSSHFTYGEMEAQRRHLTLPEVTQQAHEGLIHSAVELPRDDILLPHPVGLSLAFNPYLCVCAQLLQSCLTLCNAMDCSSPGSLSMGFSRQEYRSELPCPPPGDLPNPGIEPGSLTSPALTGRFFTPSATWEALKPCLRYVKNEQTNKQINKSRVFLPSCRSGSWEKTWQFQAEVAPIGRTWEQAGWGAGCGQMCSM